MHLACEVHIVPAMALFNLTGVVPLCTIYLIHTMLLRYFKILVLNFVLDFLLYYFFLFILLFLRVVYTNITTTSLVLVCRIFIENEGFTHFNALVEIKKNSGTPDCTGIL